MSIQTEIERISKAKSDIKTSLESKGITIPNSTLIDEYNNFIDDIESLKGEERTFTQNGTYQPSEGKNGMTTVEVNVQPDTSDATATASDIASGKTAYIASGLVEGTGKLQSDKAIVSFDNFNDEGYPTKAEINKLKDVNGVLRVPDYLLYGNTSNTANGKSFLYDISSIKINGNPSVIGNYTFNNLKSLKEVNIPSSVEQIGNYAFQGCSSLEITELPDSIKKLEWYTFDGCTNLALTKLPAQIQSFAQNTFQNCKNMTVSEIPEENFKQNQLSNGVFQGCSKITISKLPKIVTSFYMSGFRGCTSITEFEFHENFRGFGSGNNFNGCTSLKVLKFKCTTPPQLGNVNNFTNCPLERIEVPVGTLEAYQTATNWTNYASLMVEV